MKDKKLGTLILAVMMMLSGWTQAPARAENTVDTVDVSALFKNKDVEENWETDSTRVIDLNAFESGSVVSITEKGDYVLSGSLEGQILIAAPEDEKVRLILNGVVITSPQGPAIYEKQADKLIITLAEDSENALTDGEVILDGDDTIGAAIYAEDDLSINGAGSLSATGTLAHGIQSKADLIIANGEITVQAEKDGIRGRNSVLVLDGEIAVTAGGDGLDSNGSILISGGVIGVWSATTRGEGAIDFNGTGTISGGTLLVASTGGVMQDTAGLSGQPIMTFSADGLAGETVTISTSDGLALGSYTPEESFDTLMVSSAQLQEGDKCTITCGNRTLFSGEMSGSIASVGSENMGFGRNKNRRGW